MLDNNFIFGNSETILTAINVFLAVVIFLFVFFELYGVNRDLRPSLDEEFVENTGNQTAPKLSKDSNIKPEGGGSYKNEPKKAGGPTEEVKVVDPLKYEFSGYHNGYFRLGTFLFQWGVGGGEVYLAKSFDHIFGGLATMNTPDEKLKKNPKVGIEQKNLVVVHNSERSCFWCVWGYKATEDKGNFGFPL